MSRPFMFRNAGPVLVETNYWTSPHARRGLCFLSTNAGCIRLLVPPAQEKALPEMTKGVREVALTRGTLDGKTDAVELLFEDGSDSPFCLQLDARQSDRLWPPADDGRPVPFAIYTQGGGKVAEFTCRLRRHPTLPYAQPWEGKR